MKNYWNYVSELRKRKTEVIFKKSIAFTQSNVLKERILGVNILAQFGTPRVHQKEIIEVLCTLLKNEKDKRSISALLYGISHNNEKLTSKQVDLLCTFKTHKSVIVKHSLVFALCSIEKEKAIETLIVLSNDKHTDVRDWATFGLGSQLKTDTEKIRTALWDRVSDIDKHTKFEAISGLAQRKDKRIKAVLQTELENIDEHGELLLKAIEQYEDKSFILNLEKKIIANRKSKKVKEDWLLNTLETLSKK